MINIPWTLPPDRDQTPELPPLPDLLNRFSGEQIHLYFFPLPRRPLRELAMKLLLLVGCLLVAPVLLYVWLIKPAGQEVTLVELVGVGLVGCDLWLFRRYAIPLWRRFWHEYSEYRKEKEYLRENPPPSEEEYDQWIQDIGRKIYELAPEKLHISYSKEYSEEWVKDIREGVYREAPKRWNFEVSLQTRGYPLPSSKTSPEQDKSQQAYKWAARLGERHYSINVFARLFITKDYIAIYTNTINVREPEKIKEKAEHFYHRHLTYVSRETVTRVIGDDIVKQDYLSLKLDSNYTIRLHAAFVKIIYANYESAENGVDATHAGLLNVLSEHKMSEVRSFVEASKVQD
ncbi:MAG TPA: hypothetical protein VKV19_20420 [Ktedonobacteraceae bacterium]|nr:hypothetical protein [Ktedonobacteraceae bacterium]